MTVYWFDKSVLDQVPDVFSKYTVAHVAGIEPVSASGRLRIAYLVGTVQFTGWSEDGHKQYRWAPDATLEDKAALLAVSVGQQIDKVLEALPEVFSTRHVPARLFQNKAENVAHFMKNARRSGKIVKVCATSKPQTTWRRASN